MDITPEMIDALDTLRKFSTLVKQEYGAAEIDKEAALAVDLLDNEGFFAAIDEAGECGDTSAPLPEPPCDLDKPCPVHEERGPGEGVVYGQLPNHKSGPSVADVMFGKLPR